MNNSAQIYMSINNATNNSDLNLKPDLVIFPFVLVFVSVFVLFAGLCIYFVFFCPSFIRELQLDTVAAAEEGNEVLLFCERYALRSSQISILKRKTRFR